jgi:hypothetical protein
MTMEHIEVTRENGPALAKAMLNAIGDEKLDEAGIWLDKLKELNQLTEDHPDILKFRTMIMVQRGQVDEALAYLNSLEDDVIPDMRVMCMLYSGDPGWEERANWLADNSASAEIRSTMSTLLDREGRFSTKQ